MGSGTFVGLAALVWLSFRRVDGIEAIPPFDRCGERRALERTEDGLFIMRPASSVALGFAVSVRAGKFQ